MVLSCVVGPCTANLGRSLLESLAKQVCSSARSLVVDFEGCGVVSQIVSECDKGQQLQSGGVLNVLDVCLHGTQGGTGT
jgi:hypothetical protein